MAHQNRRIAKFSGRPLIAASLFFLSLGAPLAEEPLAKDRLSLPAPRTLSLEACLEEALENNHGRKVSRLAVAVAEAQHEQALAGYWPQVGLRGGYEHSSSAPDFLYPAFRMQVPAGTATINLPAGIVGPNPVQLPVSTPAQSIAVPAQDVKLANPDSFAVSVEARWLLYDGGMRRGFGEEAKAQVDLMKEEARRTDLEIRDSVIRFYYGAVLARDLVDVGHSTLAKMEATLNLTSTMYQDGSGKVMKTDWLDNKIMVESIRAMVVELEKNKAMAEAALANTMGLPWNASVSPADREIPYSPVSADLEDLVLSAFKNNPEYAKLRAGLRAGEGGIVAAKSEYYPKIAATGAAHEWWNGYDAGIATNKNKTGWSVGVGLELPLFSGFATKNKVDEQSARLAKIKEEEVLLKDGIGLEVKNAVLSLAAAGKALEATREALDASRENSSLNARAYESGLVETEKVIRAELLEALMASQHLKARYDHVAAKSEVELKVGSAIPGDAHEAIQPSHLQE